MYIVEFKCICLHMDGRDIYNILGGKTCPYQYSRANLEEATAAQCAPVILTYKNVGLLCGIFDQCVCVYGLYKNRDEQHGFHGQCSSFVVCVGHSVPNPSVRRSEGDTIISAEQ